MTTHASGEANLRVLATLSGDPLSRVPIVLDRVGLGGRGRDPYKSYSLGMKQRLGIAAALLGDPQLLVLDEPTNGLDPDGIREVRELIRDLAAEGPTVFVSSHLLSELQHVCDHLVVLDKGAQVFQGPTTALLEGGDELVLAPEHEGDVSALADVLLGLGLTPARSGPRLHLPATADPAHLNRAAAEAGITLTELHVVRASLEQRYDALMGACR